MTEDLHKHEIDGLFRHGLEGAEDSPSPQLWSAIEKGLGTNPSPHVPKTTPATGDSWMHPLLLKGLAGISILAVVGTASYFLGRDSRQREERRMEEPTVSAIPQHTPVAPSIPIEERKDNPSISSQASTIDANGTTSKKGMDDNNMTGPDGMDADILPPRTSNPPTRKAPELAGQTRNPATAPFPKPAAPVDTKVTKKPAEDPPNSPSIGVVPKSDRPSDQSRPYATLVAIPGQDKGLDRSGVSPFDPTAMERRGYAPPVVATKPADRRWLPLTSPTLNARSMAKRVSPALTNRTGGNFTRYGLDRQLLSRISLMPMLLVNTTSKRIEENENFGPRNGREHREMAETESYGTNVSPGFYAAFDITPRLSVQSGFSELRHEISISPKEIKAVRDRDNNVRYRLDCSAGTFFIEPKTGTTPIVGDSIRIKGSDVKTRYASIPLHLMYRVGNGRLRVFGMAGAEINFLVGRNATTTVQNAASQRLGTVRAEGLRPTTVNAVMGAGLEAGIGKHLSLSVIPQYRTALRSANEAGPVKSYPKTFSVAAGLRVNF